MIFAANHLIQQFLLRLHQKFPPESVHYTDFSVQLFPGLHPCIYQCGQIHASGQYGGMGIGGTAYRDKCKDLFFVHFHRLAGRQVVRRHDHRLVGQYSVLRHPCKNPDYPLGNIFDVRSPCFHIFIIHGCKHLCELILGDLHGILRIKSLFQHLIHRIQIIVVLQHHFMYIENHGMVFAYTGQCLFIKSGQLFLCRLHRIRKSSLLCLFVRSLCPDYLILLLPVPVYPADRYSFKYTLSSISLHPQFSFLCPAVIRFARNIPFYDLHQLAHHLKFHFILQHIVEALAFPVSFHRKPKGICFPENELTFFCFPFGTAKNQIL